MSRGSEEARPAESVDWPDIVALSSQNDLGLSASQVRNFIEDDLTNFTLLIFDNRLVGFAISGSFVSDEVTLMQILISPNQRRRGLGQKLLTENLKVWKEKGAEKCLLELRKSNNEAMSFYMKIGFVVDGFRANYYSMSDQREDAILMSAPL